MENTHNFASGLLALAYVLITSDGEISETELKYLEKIKESEHLTDGQYASFQRSLIGKTEREIYQVGIDAMNLCSDQEKLNAFVRLYQMALSDGVMHVKEVRLLLYAVKLVDIEFNDVISRVNVLTC